MNTDCSAGGTGAAVQRNYPKNGMTVSDEQKASSGLCGVEGDGWRCIMSVHADGTGVSV